MITAEITFYGKINGRPFGQLREFKDEKHIDNFIQYMARKGFYLDEIYYVK